MKSNVHPLYAVTAFISAVIVIILLISAQYHRKGIEKKHRIIFLWVIFFCMQDGIWGLFASHVFQNKTLLFLCSNIFHLSAIFSAFAWTVYFLSRIKIKSGYARIYQVFAGVLVLMQLGMVIANISSRFMFYVDEKGWYQTTNYRAIMFYLQFATYILIGIVSLVGTAREQKGSKKGLAAIFFVNLSPLLFSVFQMIYPDAPADSIGFAIGCVIVELFLSRDYEEQVINLEEMQKKLEDNLLEITRQNTIIEKYAGELQDNADQLANYKKAVLSDALIALEINLTKDELYYGAWKDDTDNEVLLKDILGLEIPCSYDVYIKDWYSKFVKKADVSVFSGKTAREYLIRSFREGQTEVTFDYEGKTVSGRDAWLRNDISMIRIQSGDVIAFASVKDITALIEQQKIEESYIRALATEYDSIAVVGLVKNKYEDRVIQHSRISENMIALIDDETANEVQYSKKLDLMKRFVHPGDQEQYYQNTRREKIYASFMQDKTHVVDFRIMKPGETDEFLYHQLRFIPLRNDKNEPIAMIACIRNTDSEVRKDLEGRISYYHARHDTLTGLLNRMAYDERLEELSASEGASGVVFTDMNGLKFANDNYGHEAGDNLLIRYAKLLSSHFRKDETFRISGDEFVVLLGNTDESVLNNRKERFLEALSADNIPMASTGYAYGNNRDIRRLIKKAETEMYIDKDAFHKQHPELARN